MLHAVIMAGGSGTRFWPASRRDVPKQLLRLVGERTMIQATSDRLEGLVPAEQRMVVTNRRLVAAVAEQLPELPAEQIIGEPCKRDTAPCIGLAATLLLARDPEATMLVLPSDHVIGTREQFQAAITAGMALLEEDPRRIVTYGIPPTYAAESFGYIERGNPLAAKIPGLQAFEVARFREKPDRATAESYLAAGTFYWNSGIFLWRASTILDAIGEAEPAMAARLERIGQAVGAADFDAVLEREFAAIEGKSIDYAVMERYQPVAVIEAAFSWDDLGSWQALARMVPPDRDGNTVQGQHVGIDTRGAIIRSDDGHVVVTIGVEDLVIVHTPGATLVAPKAAEERVREAVRRLEEEGLDALL
ncbi:mannose-1-phosphate guanylyltransferase [Candidatus Laterigemmans baculatus]|uniref:mannose-1-phosphate guanylyltransferase n=1 Tax=Candidatus Laterigemmans baculatus TaxID=2770505 RepID=UPI0013D955E8|nr:mannose-1-phosphate guanylyltransferase [Candidatus Laterigemmans baculatus]